MFCLWDTPGTLVDNNLQQYVSNSFSETHPKADDGQAFYRLIGLNVPHGCPIYISDIINILIYMMFYYLCN